MDIQTVRKNAFIMPLTSPASSQGPWTFINREFFIITYRTSAEALQAVVPAPLEIDKENPLVKFEFINMPDSWGFGSYTESGQVIPVSLNGQRGGYTHAMYLNDFAPTACGRELWGFPKKMASPRLVVEQDCLVGTLDYGPLRVATATMGYKFTEMDPEEAKAKVSAPGYLLKIIPHVDGAPRILELIEYHCEEVTIKGAWHGPAGLQLFSHALAPVAGLPVIEIVSAEHIIADLKLGLGKVVYDYLV